MRLGVQVSIAKGAAHAAREAVARGCEAVQVFSSNPRGWALPASVPSSDRALREALDEAGIGPLLVHVPYLVNIAATDDEVYARSVASLTWAADRARRIDGLVVVHAGRDRRGPRERTLERAAVALRTARKLATGAGVLIEPTAGGAGSVASTTDELAELLEAIDDVEVGVCLDTCHVHAAGHDLSSQQGAKAWLRGVGRNIGFDRVRALHVNDSRDPPGSHRDRHWHIGQGTIGPEGFRAILSDRRLHKVPGILETPGTLADDRRNLARARAYAGGK